MSAKNQEKTKKLNALRVKFQKKLQTRFDNLIASWSKFQTAPSEEDFQLILHEVHKLSGSGATFGFPKVSELARPAEFFLHDVTKHHGIQFSQAQKEQFTLLLEALSKALDPSQSESKSTEGFPLLSPGQSPNVVLCGQDLPLIQYYKRALEDLGLYTHILGDTTQFAKQMAELQASVVVFTLYTPEEAGKWIENTEALSVIDCPIVVLQTQTLSTEKRPQLQEKQHVLLQAPILCEPFIATVTQCIANNQVS